MKTIRFLFPGVLLILLLFASCSTSETVVVSKDPVKNSSAARGESVDEEEARPTDAGKEKAEAPETSPRDGWDAPEPLSDAPVEHERAESAMPEIEEHAAETTVGGAYAPKKVLTRGASASGLKAGFADDNRQFNYFLEFLEKNKSRAPNYPIRIQERIVLKVRDENGRSAPNSNVEIFVGNDKICKGLTLSDGSFLFFPLQHDGEASRYTAVVSRGSASKTVQLDRQGKRQVEIELPFRKADVQSAPLDILFIMDTTGSMGEEIERLKTTLEIIKLNLASLSSRPTIRFGMVLYKDRRDSYVTRIIPLTGDVDHFQSELNRVRASGGGDHPEDLQSALRDAMEKIRWNKNGVRLGFIITDAAPHLDYGQAYTYARAVSAAREKGIKLFSVGTGGLDIAGEYVLRQISQYTNAKYIFLTYGEKGESEGGAPGSVSHHTGSNYRTDKLEAIIIRIAKDELAWFSDAARDQDQDYFTAHGVPGEEREETLRKLFDMALSQLVDYSSFRIPGGATASVVPVSSRDNRLGADAEYFTEQLMFALAESGRFKLVDRGNIQEIADELKLQMTDLMDPKNTVRLGKLLGAEMLVTGALYSKSERFELFLKLLRVETGEILSVTKLSIDSGLGLGR